jgi:hypothetical protein
VETPYIERVVVILANRCATFSGYPVEIKEDNQDYRTF